MRPLAAAAFAYLSFMWGSTYLFIKVGLEYWPPIMLSAARNLVACLIMILILKALRRPWPSTWRGWWPPIVYGLANGSGFGLISWGEQFIPSGQTAVLIATVPLFTLFLANWVTHERITTTKALAVFVGIVGVALSTGVRGGEGFFGTDAQRLIGQTAMLAAAIGYASSAVIGKRFFQADMYANTTIHLASSGLGLLAFSLIFDPPATSAIFTAPAIGSLLYLAIPGSAFAFLALFYLLSQANSLQSTYFTLVNPIVALLLGVAFLKERIAPMAIAGSLLVLGGAWLVNRPERQG